MAATTTLSVVDPLGTRYHTQRINRRLDDRDNVIKEALATLEEKDPSYFPTINKVTPQLNSGSLAQSDTVCTVSGVNLSATASDWEVLVGGVAGVVGSAATNGGAITLGAALSASQGDMVLVQIWISETLATEFFVTVA